MKLTALTFILLPAFLFAQQEDEFTVKKKAPIKLYYSKGQYPDTVYTRYLLVLFGKVCHYQAPDDAESQLINRPWETMFGDTTVCHNYTADGDTIKYKLSASGYMEPLGQYTQKIIYSLYPAGQKFILHGVVSYSDNSLTDSWSTTFTEFILPDEK